ncbi:MAG TPA: ABC transporter permease [Candidatus Eisenbacteria bacterium]|nr:ABC transporter permease [Candidatus Eisenbacteria bacterium]
MLVPIAYGTRSLFVRRWTSIFTAGGIGLVVAVTILLAGLVGGLQRMLVGTGDPDNLVVLRKGATNDGSSFLTREAVQIVRALPGIATGADGRPLVSPEIINQPFMRTREGGRENVLVRGIEPVAFEVHRDVRLVEGRMLQPKLGEVVVGKGVALRHDGAHVGGRLSFGRRTWTVVGVFDGGGTAFDSEIWADLSDVQDDARRPSGCSGIRLRIAPGADRQALVERIAADARVTLEGKPETVYYEEQAEAANSLYVLVLVLAVIMATGATFGALNTMYAAVAGRTAEIGTLRALGFSRTAILLSFLSESLLLAAGGFVGGVVLGVAAMWAVNTLLQGVAFSMMTFSVATVLLQPSTTGVLLGLLFAIAIGGLGGLAPAWRASRLRVVDALHRA